jgi:Holliday junction resolvasome RuvABC ATP-dependent DNA helicase subunit
VEAGVEKGDIIKKLESIEQRLEGIEKILKEISLTRAEPSIGAAKPSSLTVGVEGLLGLPDSLRKSMMALQELGEATAEETAVKTNRTRSVESIYLNQLVRMGLLQRTRRGKKVYFEALKYY